MTVHYNGLSVPKLTKIKYVSLVQIGVKITEMGGAVRAYQSEIRLKINSTSMKCCTSKEFDEFTEVENSNFIQN